MPQIGRLDETAGTLPLVLTPTADHERSADAVVAYLRDPQSQIPDRLAAHGAILLRGFDLADPAAFERVARAIDGELKNNYLGTSPRDALTPYVFSASELPGYYPIAQHCEMSFLKKPPRRLFFCCLRPNDGPGGETPLCDFRKVARDLAPAVLDRFERRGVRIIRNYCGPSGGSRWDLWKLKRWDEMFQTTDRATVAAICRENDFAATFYGRDRLRLIHSQPAVIAHPTSGEKVWFNHSQVFHLSMASGEYQRIAARQGPALKYHSLAAFAATLAAVKSRTAPREDQALHCTFGDGSEIPDSDMEAVREAIWKNLVAFKWRTGDVVAIDNFAVSHGRMPYKGPRRIAVCWA